MRVLRALGIFLLVIILAVVVAIGAIYLLSNSRMHRKYAFATETLPSVSDPAQLERGGHLVKVRLGCVSCHGEDLGGSVVIDAMPFGRFIAPNLTAGDGGVGARYSDADWVRLLRHGIRPDGTPVVFMPVNLYTNLGAEDLQAVVAYVKSVPPVSRQMPPTKVGPIGRMLIVTNKAPLIPAEHIDHSRAIPVPPPAGATQEYGSYIVATAGCTVCHGQGLSGGKLAGGPTDPPAQNITPTGIGSWSEIEFIQALRTGKRPDGTEIKPFMPWQIYGKMTDDELRAIYLYLKTVPPKPNGEG
jgi:cytochrome c553